jgi:exodeoxyribonuclease VII large subunit
MEQQSLDFTSAPRPQEPAEPRIFKVSEVTGGLKLMLEKRFASLWIEGEVSNFRISPSGHAYFSLKDEKAVLKAALFKGYLSRVKFQIKDGVQLICHGSLSMFEKGGDLNFIVDHCEPKGIGALQLAFEQLKEKLSREGLFDAKRKKPLPFLPKKIGIVTSPAGAAIRDILNVLGRRYPGIDVLLYPVRVQGEGSAAEIAEAVRYMNTRSDIDVMIVGRGGGSLEDLWAFNEEAVARAIFASGIPVISAVGHEIDFTISDFVADRRAPTPSAAAELVVPKKDDLVKLAGGLKAQLLRALQVSFDLKNKFFEQVRSHLKPPTARFPDLIMQIDSLRERLQNGIRSWLDRNGAQLKQLAAELNHLSPLNVLAKGYSVVYKGAEVVKRAADVKKGDELRIRMSKGEVRARSL